MVELAAASPLRSTVGDVLDRTAGEGDAVLEEVADTAVGEGVEVRARVELWTADEGIMNYVRSLDTDRAVTGTAAAASFVSSSGAVPIG